MPRSALRHGGADDARRPGSGPPPGPADEAAAADPVRGRLDLVADPPFDPSALPGAAAAAAGRIAAPAEAPGREPAPHRASGRGGDTGIRLSGQDKPLDTPM